MATKDGNYIVWTSDDLEDLNLDKGRLIYVIAGIQNAGGGTFRTIYQDANACAALVQLEFPPPDQLGLVSSASRPASKPAKKSTAKKAAKKTPRNAKAAAKNKKRARR